MAIGSGGVCACTCESLAAGGFPVECADDDVVNLATTIVDLRFDRSKAIGLGAKQAHGMTVPRPSTILADP